MAQRLRLLWLQKVRDMLPALKLNTLQTATPSSEYLTFSSFGFHVHLHILMDEKDRQIDRKKETHINSKSKPLKLDPGYTCQYFKADSTSKADVYYNLYIM